MNLRREEKRLAMPLKLFTVLDGALGVPYEVGAKEPGLGLHGVR